VPPPHILTTPQGCGDEALAIRGPLPLFGGRDAVGRCDGPCRARNCWQDRVRPPNRSKSLRDYLESGTAGGFLLTEVGCCGVYSEQAWGESVRPPSKKKSPARLGSTRGRQKDSALASLLPFPIIEQAIHFGQRGVLVRYISDTMLPRQHELRARMRVLGS